MIHKINFLKKKDKIFIIAEAGSNHLGKLSRAYKLVDLAKNCGADAVKFQSFVADEIATKNSKHNRIKNKFKKFSNNLYNFYEKFELPQSFNEKIFNYCKKKNIIFMSSIFGEKSLKITKKINPFFKISSFEANYFELFEKIIKLKKPIIISTGCSSEKEIKKIKNFFKNYNFSNYSIMHCGSSYPLKFKDVNLRYILKLKKMFKKNLIGYSDHTIGISSCLAAVTLGAKIIEKHITLSKFDKAPDSFFSADRSEFKFLVKNIRELEKSLGEEKKIMTKGILEMRKARRTYFSKKNYKKGTVIKKNMFIALRPRVNMSVEVDDIYNLEGKKLLKNIKFEDPLLLKHVEN